MWIKYGNKIYNLDYFQEIEIQNKSLQLIINDDITNLSFSSNEERDEFIKKILNQPKYC